MTDHDPSSPPADQTDTPPFPDQPKKAVVRMRARAKVERTNGHAWSDDELDGAKAALLRNLSATKPYFNRLKKKYIEVPDPMAQIAAAVAICNQAIGLPVQRVVRVEANFRDRQAELIELAQTPSGRDMLLKSGLIDGVWLAKHLPVSGETNAEK